jgi:beta-aspartyl-peptidase (threonine type)
MQEYSLVIHGGAGAPPDPDAYRESLARIFESGRAMLEVGAPALDVVEHCVTLLEDDPLFNAGKGSVLNAKGEVEMDAALMDGKTMKAGAVSTITGVKNPIALARRVMEKTEHVLLSGAGALEFAREQQVRFEDKEYFITEHRTAQLAKAKESDRVVLDHSSIEKKYGTVGAVACDKKGDLAAATSTGGIVNKCYGRVGDTPIIGAGVYAENGTCAVSATGFGEQILRVNLAKHTAELIRHRGFDAQTAAAEAVAFMVEKVKGLGGIIVVDADGKIGVAKSTDLILATSSGKGEVPLFHF